MDAAAIVASRLVPGSMVCVMLIVGCSELSNRLVLSSGVNSIVPTKIATAATSVIALWSRAKRSAGR